MSGDIIKGTTGNQAETGGEAAQAALEATNDFANLGSQDKIDEISVNRMIRTAAIRRAENIEQLGKIDESTLTEGQKIFFNTKKTELSNQPIESTQTSSIKVEPTSTSIDQTQEINKVGSQEYEVAENEAALATARATKTEADRKTAEDEAALATARAAKIEAVRKAAEDEAALATARAAKIEADRKAAENETAIATARAAKIEADRKVAENETAIAKTKREAAEAAIAQAEADRKAAAIKAEADRKAKAVKAEADRKAEAEKVKAERKAAADKAKAERKAAADKAKIDKQNAKDEEKEKNRKEKVLNAFRDKTLDEIRKIKDYSKISIDQIQRITNIQARKEALTKKMEQTRRNLTGLSGDGLVALINDGSLFMLSGSDLKLIADDQVRYHAETALEKRRKDTITLMSETSASEMSEEEVMALSTEDIGLIDDDGAKTIINNRRSNIEANKQTLSKLQAALIRQGYSETDVDALSDEKIALLSIEDANKVSDPKAKEKLKARILELTKKKAEESAKKLNKDIDSEGESQDLDVYANRYREQLVKMLETDKTIEGPVRAAILKNIEIIDRELQGKKNLDVLQREGDKLALKKESITIRQKKFEIFFRNSKYILGGVLIGAAIGLLASGSGGDKLLYSILGGIGGVGLGFGGVGLDKLYSGKRVDLETQLQNAKIAKEQRENISTQRDRNANTRETNAIVAFKKKRAEISARMAGYTNPEQVAAFVGASSLGADFALANFNN